MTAKKKILSVVLVIALVAITVVGSSLAYFTDKTDTKTNAFTMGDVDIELYEPDWQGNTPTLMPGVTFDKDPFIGVKADSQDAWVFMEVTVNKFNSWLELNAAYLNKDLYLDEDGTLSPKFAEDYITSQENETKIYTDIISKWFTVDSEYTQDVDKTAVTATEGNWILKNWDDVKAQLEESWDDDEVNPNTLTLIFGYDAKISANGYTKPLFTDVTMPFDITSEMIDLSGFNTKKADWKINVTAYGIQAAGLVDLDRAYDALPEALPTE